MTGSTLPGTGQRDPRQGPPQGADGASGSASMSPLPEAHPLLDRIIRRERVFAAVPRARRVPGDLAPSAHGDGVHPRPGVRARRPGRTRRRPQGVQPCRSRAQGIRTEPRAPSSRRPGRLDRPAHRRPRGAADTAAGVRRGPRPPHRRARVHGHLARLGAAAARRGSGGDRAGAHGDRHDRRRPRPRGRGPGPYAAAAGGLPGGAAAVPARLDDHAGHRPAQRGRRRTRPGRGGPAGLSLRRAALGALVRGARRVPAGALAGRRAKR